MWAEKGDEGQKRNTVLFFSHISPMRWVIINLKTSRSASASVVSLLSVPQLDPELLLF